MTGAPSSFRAVAADLVDVFRRGADQGLSDDELDDLAIRSFRHQLETNPIYAGYCRRRGATAETVSGWEEIPPVPTRAFKHLRLVSGPPGLVQAVFLTSGTSRGRESRGAHHVLDLELYRESLLPSFRHHVLPDGARLPVVSLIPSPERAPDSSLSHMMGVVVEELGGRGGGWFVDPDRGILLDDLHRVLREHEAASTPVLVAGTAFSFVHWMDALDREGLRFRCAPGSRIMETGGFKGRSRVVERDELYAGLTERTGIPTDRMVNEYGMSELLSQLYARAGEPHRGPPWLRTRVLDPGSLAPLPAGERGLLCHFDLANLGSVCAVLTEDEGIAVDGGVRILGRVAGAEPRGCSLAMDELLAEAGGEE